MIPALKALPLTIGTGTAGGIVRDKTQSVPHHPLVVMWGRQTEKGWKTMEPNRAAHLMAEGYV